MPKRWRGEARAWLLVLAFAALGPWACTDKRAPEYIADQFVDAYFRRMDQQGARQFTALGATEMLDRELELTRAVRSQYSPEEAISEVACRRIGRHSRGERVRFDYEISIKQGDAEEHRAADIELAEIQSAWKVVRVDVKTPDPKSP